VSPSLPNWRVAKVVLKRSPIGIAVDLSKLVAPTCLLIATILSVSGCTGGQSLQKTFAPDPKLKQPVSVGNPAVADPVAAIPADFPRYPQAKLQSTEQTTDGGTVTTWTSDPIDFVYKFYQQELTAKQWQIVTQPSDSNPSLTAKLAQTEISISPQTSSDKQQTGVTTYTISLSGATAATPTQTQPPAPAPTETNPTPAPTASPLPSTKPIAKLPATITEYLKDLTQIGVLTSADTAPNRPVTRREYARWLVAAHNRITGTKPTQQVKLATTDTKPVFQDVPSTNPDFPSIQGLAEAGLIPSPLSGDATAVLFRPDAPLTREQMILWKVPLDTRQTLPNASVDAVKQTWGFQDAGKVDPKALRAVLADFQNGEQSNIRRAFGYTTLFQPKKTVNLGEVATALWYFGANSEGLSARDAIAIEK
jgi:S-layer homology domain